jgi:hypothetical protein
MVPIIFLELQDSSVQSKSKGHDLGFDQQWRRAAIDATTGPTVLDPLPDAAAALRLQNSTRQATSM